MVQLLVFKIDYVFLCFRDLNSWNHIGTFWMVQCSPWLIGYGHKFCAFSSTQSFIYFLLPWISLSWPKECGRRNVRWQPRLVLAASSCALLDCGHLSERSLGRQKRDPSQASTPTAREGRLWIFILSWALPHGSVQEKPKTDCQPTHTNGCCFKQLNFGMACCTGTEN